MADDVDRIELARIQTARLIEMRDTLKRVMPDDGYASTLAGWKRSVRQVMHRQQCSAIVAFIRLGEAARDGGSDGVVLLWLAAAAVEIIEEEGRHA